MNKSILFASALIASTSGAAWSQGLITVEDVLISETVTTETFIERFMGNSNKAPPNENAANSRGVRTETTVVTTTATTTADVTGPRGQINQGNYGCNNCTQSNLETVTNVETETSVSGPGNGTGED